MARPLSNAMDTSAGHIAGYIPRPPGTDRRPSEPGRTTLSSATQHGGKPACPANASKIGAASGPVSAAQERQTHALANPNRTVRLEFDPSAHRVITKIVDRRTNEVIREIPPEKLRRAAALFREYVNTVFDVAG